MKYSDYYGSTFQRTGSGRKKLRLICIFLIVAAVSVLVVWLTLPDNVKNKKNENKTLSNKNIPSEHSEDVQNGKKDLPHTGEGSVDENSKTAVVLPGGGKTVDADDKPSVQAKDPLPESPKGVPGPGDTPAALDKPEIPAEKNSSEAEKKLLEIKKLYQQGDLIRTAEGAADLLEKLTDGSQASRSALQLLSNANWERFLKGDSSNGFAIRYKVSAGDYLGRIAWRNRTTVAGIMKANNLKNTRIRIGQTLFLLSGDWKITVSKAKRQLFLWRGGKLFMGFDVGIGRFGKTPTADFVIMDRLKNPEYRTADGRIFKHGTAGNELGDYFLKLASAGAPKRPLVGYGIHGTSDESSVTRSLSNGCIRMRNADVERLYYIVPTGTRVEIKD